LKFIFLKILSQYDVTPGLSLAHNFDGSLRYEEH